VSGHKDIAACPDPVDTRQRVCKQNVKTDSGASRLRFHRCAPRKTLCIELVNLHVLPAGPIQTNAYLLTDPVRGEAVLIDAPGDIWEDVAPILAAEKCRLVELWLTHGHWDHTQGAAEVTRKSGAKVRAHEDDRVLIETPDIMERFMGEKMNLQPVNVDHWVVQGDQWEALGVPVEVRHVPGHCPGNVLFYFAAFGSAFVGDALFNGSIGRTDLPGGDFEQLAAAIRKQIYTLPPQTAIFPGHGPKTSVAVERANNPYVHD
jgi:glyoxylase-like metal-dependent hydrolase (beta-lactamase superfamily II)